MKDKEKGITRRGFMQLGAGFGAFAALGGLKAARAVAATAAADYKALVCVFLYGGNDGHNTVVPLGAAEYNNYKTARGTLALPPSQLLAVGTSAGAAYGLHYGLAELQALYNQGRLAVVSNVGMLVRPITRQQYLGPSPAVPTNLFSHADQVVQMQTGTPNTSAGTGWGGRAADLMQAANASANFPTAVSMAGTSLFCTGGVAQSASIQPGNYLDQYAMSFWPQSAADARAQAQREIVTTASGNLLVDAANRSMKDALALGAMLKGAAGSPAFSTLFPQTSLGNQLKEVARVIGLRAQVGVRRQVFFCGLGGFDLHSGQAWNHWDLLTQLSQALGAFYSATVELGVADSVTAFTLSDFGRTLQPGGTGSDHGWGSHHLVLGGAVRGGDLYGTFPQLVLGGPDDANSRGVLIPTTSVAQYGATLGRWFGAGDAELDAIFPTLSNFSARDLGFLG